MTDAERQPGPGRPRKRAPEEQVGARYAEAHRLEELRDEAQAAWLRDRTMAAKAALCAAEMQAATAWAAAMRADNKHDESFAYTKAAQNWAQAHDKAIAQLVYDRVASLEKRVFNRERARTLASTGDESA